LSYKIKLQRSLTLFVRCTLPNWVAATRDLGHQIGKELACSLSCLLSCCLACRLAYSAYERLRTIYRSVVTGLVLLIFLLII